MPAAAATRSSRLLRSFAVVVAFALGVVAVWMVVVGDTKQTKVGVLIGLWGLLIAAYPMLGARNRGSADSDPAQTSAGSALEVQSVVQERRVYEQRLEAALRRQVHASVASEMASMKAEISALRSDLVEKVGGQLRLERIETTRLIGSDLEAMKNEVRQLADRPLVTQRTIEAVASAGRAAGLADDRESSSHSPSSYSPSSYSPSSSGPSSSGPRSAGAPSAAEANGKFAPSSEHWGPAPPASPTPASARPAANAARPATPPTVSAPRPAATRPDSSIATPGRTTAPGGATSWPVNGASSPAQTPASAERAASSAAPEPSKVEPSKVESSAGSVQAGSVPAASPVPTDRGVASFAASRTSAPAAASASAQTASSGSATAKPAAPREHSSQPPSLWPVTAPPSIPTPLYSTAYQNAGAVRAGQKPGSDARPSTPSGQTSGPTTSANPPVPPTPAATSTPVARPTAQQSASAPAAGPGDPFAGLPRLSRFADANGSSGDRAAPAGAKPAQSQPADRPTQTTAWPAGASSRSAAPNQSGQPSQAAQPARSQASQETEGAGPVHASRHARPEPDSSARPGGGRRHREPGVDSDLLSKILEREGH